MKQDVLITIKGTQHYDEDKDAVELLTKGRFYRKNGSYFICYDESEATGFEGTRTTLKIEDDRCITMMRSGNNRSQLIIERGVRHQCSYDTGHGSMTIGVSGDKIVTQLTDDGGEVEFKYSLDLNATLTSENTVKIKVKKYPES